jgi:hypothetical protein
MRIDWKYAHGLELTDSGFDHTVLSEFRMHENSSRKQLQADRRRQPAYSFTGSTPRTLHPAVSLALNTSMRSIEIRCLTSTCDSPLTRDGLATSPINSRNNEFERYASPTPRRFVSSRIAGKHLQTCRARTSSNTPSEMVGAVSFWNSLNFSTTR